MNRKVASWLKTQFQRHSQSRSKISSAERNLSEILLQASAAINASKAARNTYKYLWDSEVRVFSQWGEDGILDYLFDITDISKPRILEFGAGNFTECNSRFTAEYRNASAYLVDMRDDLVEHTKQLEIYWRNSIFPNQDFITPESAQQHLQKARQHMGGVDVISLDIDGNDYWVLEALDLSEVSIVVCEYNPIYGATGSYTVKRDDNFDRTKAHFSWLHYGMSLKAAIDLLSNQGLVFIGSNRVGNNAFFLKDSHLKHIPFPIPNHQKLDSFVDWRVRESRDENGCLSYLSLQEAREILCDLEVINLQTEKTIKIISILEKD
jgi:hypothetical protein